MSGGPHFKWGSVCLWGPQMWLLVASADSLQWCHNEGDDVSNHRRLDCFLNCMFRRRLKKTSKLRVAGLCKGNSPMTGELSAQRSSNAENVSIWWWHHVQIEVRSLESHSQTYDMIDWYKLSCLWSSVTKTSTSWGMDQIPHVLQATFRNALS